MASQPSPHVVDEAQPFAGSWQAMPAVPSGLVHEYQLHAAGQQPPWGTPHWQSMVHPSQCEPSGAQSASVVQATVDKHTYAAVQPASAHAPPCASGFSAYPSGRPLHAMLMTDPSHAQPAAYAWQTAPGDGKQEPCALQTSTSGKPQIALAPQSALVVQGTCPAAPL
jgi:hypothetical protein